MAVAEHEDIDPNDLPPLFKAVDTEALETLVDAREVEVSFTYCGYDITVTSDEQLTIRSSDNTYRLSN